MSSTLLEQMRLNHEAIESYERSVCSELDRYPSGQKAKVLQQHKVSKIIDLLVEKSNELSKMYQDEDKLLEEELDNMKGSKMFSSFYETLNMTREYHQRFPNQPVLSIQSTYTINDDTINIQFSGEEVYGKYLDLNAQFLLFINLPNCPSKNIDYLQYLDMFSNFFYITTEIRNSKAYSHYIHELLSYLKDFFYRIQPLINFHELVDSWKKSYLEITTTTKNGTTTTSTTTTSIIGEPIRLGMFQSVEELEVLGLERLQQGLIALGLKSGGTLQERAARLWSVRGKKPEEYPKKLLAKRPAETTTTATTTATANNNTSITNNGMSNGQNGVEKKIDENNVLWKEYVITKICESMMDIVIATRHHAEKQQTRKPEEKEQELKDEEIGTLPPVHESTTGETPGGNDDDEEEEPLYNPLNIPLGWDGKPIPYWLYKLHGLGIEYKCEICGNQSYWGRRAFDRHFQEWRHAHGMRCLGVPNTKHFHDITLIEDVLALYNKIKDTLVVDQFVTDVHEEYEDSQGNVLNRRTYEDLARQGLL